MVEGAKHHLDRDLFERLIEALGHVLADVAEHEVEEEGGLELELDAIGRGFPEGSKIEHALGHQEGVFYAPAAPIQLTDLPRRELRRIKDIGQIALPLAAPEHRDQTSRVPARMGMMQADLNQLVALVRAVREHLRDAML